MYESFFHFRFRPFAVSPDAESIFWTAGHRGAFSAISDGLERRSQVTVLTGGLGTGKTTLIRRLLQTSSDSFSVGLLSNIAGERGDLLPWVLAAFGLDTSDPSDAVMFGRLRRSITDAVDRGQRSVLIIDEAQNLSEHDLEILRLLSNLNTDEVLMMLVLVGQPQLREKMAGSADRRLCQRIGADYRLEPLTQEETSGYIRHRCGRAGGSPALFDAAACDEVHRISGGVPRKINVLCDLALSSGYADGVRTIDYDVVRSVMEDARRLGTYNSLTKHDIAGAATGPLTLLPTIRPIAGRPIGSTIAPVRAPAFDGSARAPVRRLTLVPETGGDPGQVGPGQGGTGQVGTGQVGPGEAAASEPGPVSSNPAGSVAVGEDTQTAPARDWAETTSPERAPTDATAPSAAGGARRQPLRRLTRLIEPAGGGAARSAVTRIGEVRAGVARAGSARLGSTAARVGAAATAAAREPAPSAPDQADELNALFNFTCSDDALLFIDDPAERDGGSASVAEGPATPRRREDADVVYDPRRQKEVAARSEQATAPDRPNPRSPISIADASSAGGAELALRRAFAPQAAWRWTGWRGAAAVVALAAGGSMAAGIALLPDGGTPSESKSTELRTEAGVISPELPSNLEPSVAPIAPDPADLSVTATRAYAATGSAFAHDASGSEGSVASADLPTYGPGRSDPPLGPVMPAGAADERLPTASPADGGVLPPSGRSRDVAAPAAAGAVQPAPRALKAALGDDRSAAVDSGLGVEAERGAPARQAAPTPERNAGLPIPTDLAMGPKPAAIDRPEAPAAVPPKPVDLQSDSPQSGDAEASFRHAIEIAAADPRGAAIAYAGAAMLGHARAAYYLGQIYETGDGVPVDYAIARHWYEAASPENARARSRLAALPRPEQGGELAAPLPLLARASSEGHGDFIWTSGQGADPSSYLIELGAASAESSDDAIATYPVSGSAARLPLADGAARWRVLALDATGDRSVASDWRDLSAATPDEPEAAAMPPIRPRRL